MIERLTYPAGDGRPMEAWVARPEGQGPYPAVLVVHEIYGLVDNLEPILERFAAEGYVALAPNLYDRDASGPVCVTRCMLAMQRGNGEAVDDLYAALDYLSDDPHVDDTRMAVTGFCMGGGFALVMALDARVSAAAPFYGMSDGYLEKIESSCPVVASYGQRDLVFLAKGKKLKRHLVQAGIEHDHKVYPGVGHSFMTTPRGTWTERLGKVGPMRVGYDPEAAEDAWARMLAFFGAQLS
ncbi:MAG: dienelactone hydrolase family protein [Polyangiales bacterium]